MRVLRLAAGLSLAIMAPLPASASDLSGAFGNTIVSTYPNGVTVRHWFEPDGAYRSESSSGRKLSGRWRIEGERVCLTDIRPSFVISRFCTPMVAARIGDSWNARDPLGRQTRNTLVRGR